MAKRLKIALAQIAASVGDVHGNAQRVQNIHAEARQQDVDLVVFPELHLAGYPPEDLVLKPIFLSACRDEAERLAVALSNGPAVLFGLPWVENGKVYNAVALIHSGSIAALRFKHKLPNYGVFDEMRTFSPGPLPQPVEYRGLQLGIPICEDIWQGGEVTSHLKSQGAELLIVPNGSPYSRNKPQHRRDVAAARSKETGLPLIYLNRAGGQDELVFDGNSFGLNTEEGAAFQLSSFREEVSIINWDNSTGLSGSKARQPELLESLYSACCLGLRDYVHSNGFKNVLLGLSGGVDSALVAALCVDAFGAGPVHSIMLPSQYTSNNSIEDAAACAKSLGLRYDIVSIKGPYHALYESLRPLFGGKQEDATEENMQSRLRGAMLMALSNKTGAMLVTTGNKSEMAVGYATLYGDMNGGFNPIKDLYKTQVYELARWRNVNRPAIGLGPKGQLIPERILDKAPSAELKPNQTDQDSLPPYDILDGILERLIEKERSLCEIADEGFDLETIRQVERLLALSEYKRRQAPPGVKLTSRNFGRDRRYPITNAFRDDCKPANKEIIKPDIPEYHEREE